MIWLQVRLSSWGLTQTYRVTTNGATPSIAGTPIGERLRIDRYPQMKRSDVKAKILKTAKVCMLRLEVMFIHRVQFEQKPVTALN